MVLSQLFAMMVEYSNLGFLTILFFALFPVHTMGAINVPCCEERCCTLQEVDDNVWDIHYGARTNNLQCSNNYCRCCSKYFETFRLIS